MLTVWSISVELQIYNGNQERNKMRCVTTDHDSNSLMKLLLRIHIYVLI